MCRKYTLTLPQIRSDCRHRSDWGTAWNNYPRENFQLNGWDIFPWLHSQLHLLRVHTSTSVPNLMLLSQKKFQIFQLSSQTTPLSFLSAFPLSLHLSIFLCTSLSPLMWVLLNNGHPGRKALSLWIKWHEHPNFAFFFSCYNSLHNSYFNTKP